MTEEERELMKTWLEDTSFLNWAKETNDSDIAKWELYFNSNPHHWELAKTGRLLVLGIPFGKIPSDEIRARKASEKFVERLEERNRPEKDVRILSINRFIDLRKIAAIGFIALAAYFSYDQYFQHEDVIIATTYGQQLKSVLPDGSEITLNANSTIWYNTRTPRRVHLDGEAFFDIKKKPKTQENFKVLTDDLVVIVLGTSFNVNSRNDQTKVFLEEGKIDLEVPDQKSGTIQMDPGDLITYSKSNNELREKKNNASSLEYSSWKGGALIFTEMFLADALYEIEDIYGIQFVIGTDGLGKEKISGGVPINDLNVTLQTLNEVYGINIKVHGKRYFLNRPSK